MRTSKSATLSFVIGIYELVALLGIVLQWTLGIEYLTIVTLWPFLIIPSFEGVTIIQMLFTVVGIGLGIFALKSIKNSNGLLTGIIFAILGLIFGVVAFFLFPTLLIYFPF